MPLSTTEAAAQAPIVATRDKQLQPAHRAYFGRYLQPVFGRPFSTCGRRAYKPCPSTYSSITDYTAKSRLNSITMDPTKVKSPR